MRSELIVLLTITTLIIYIYSISLNVLPKPDDTINIIILHNSISRVYKVPYTSIKLRLFINNRIIINGSEIVFKGMPPSWFTENFIVANATYGKICYKIPINAKCVLDGFTVIEVASTIKSGRIVVIIKRLKWRVPSTMVSQSLSDPSTPNGGWRFNFRVLMRAGGTRQLWPGTRQSKSTLGII